MKKLAISICLAFVFIAVNAQVKIHSHNDYEQKVPFYLAYQQRVYQIEADVFEKDGKLLVAHSKKEINDNNTLDKLYLDPIDSLFIHYLGRVSADEDYTFILMIDFKTEWQPTFLALQRYIEKYGDKFDRSQNNKAVQIVISGNRPTDALFHTFPRWIYFDGLPNVAYTRKDLKRVTMISDNFAKYSKWKGKGNIPEADKFKLKVLIDAAHELKKPFRFWGAPDTEDCWRELLLLGADIINTDKLVESSNFIKRFKY